MREPRTERRSPTELLTWFLVAAVYLFLFVPMIVLVVLSFNAAPRGAEWQGFTLQWYSKLLEDDLILEALANSLQVAIGAMVLSAVFGLSVAVVSVRSSRRLQYFIKKSATLPIVLPDIVIGLSLLCFFVFVGIPLGKFSVLLAHAAFGTAYVSTLVKARLISVDPLLEEAAADLGASRATTFFKVLLPQLMPAVISGMLMVFTLSFDDFSIAFFTAGVGATTLPLRIYSMLKFGVSPEVNALSALILLVSLGLVSLAFWGQGRKRVA